MDLTKIIAELRAEREQIDHVILLVDRMARGQGKRRGRPPKWMNTIEMPKRRGRPPGSKNTPKDQH